MALSNLYGWNEDVDVKSAASCGTACGAGDDGKDTGSACGAGDTSSSCGASDK